MATLEVDGVFGLKPAGPDNYVAIEITHAPGVALSGLLWFHNDETVEFPSLILMEGETGNPPDLLNAALILEELSGASLDWGEAMLETPVTSTTGSIFAVFSFPAEGERTAEGTGGGPGMGYRHKPASTNPRAYISPDGEQWFRVHEDFEVALEPAWGSGKSAPVSLASLKNERDGASDHGELATAEAVPEQLDTTPLKIYPNPLNPRTEVRLYLEKSVRVQVEIFDLRGRRVASLLDARRPAGPVVLVWEGADYRGHDVSSGIYMLRAKLGERVFRQRLALIR
jgi:hypothetical protein